MVVHVLRRYTLISATAALALVTLNLDASTPQDLRDVTPLPKELQQPQKNFSDDVPAHISVVDGQVDLEHDGKVERAEANMILLAGDRLRTSRGRLEVLFDDGSALHLDDNSTVDLLSESLIRLRAGRLRLLVARTSNPIEYKIDAAAGSAIIRAAGEYRLQVADGRSSDFELRVTVIRGMAEVTNDAGRTTVRTGSEVFASANRAPSPPYSINSAMVDSFERWAQQQIDARLSVESARYLPDEVRYDAGVFDTYGSWGYEPSYGGHVWYPTVAYGRPPYYPGHSRNYAHYGWTWHGYDRWSWATHHYGRWGYSNRWYWVPTAGWGPAWVAWGYAPGYVSWCPLGWGGSAVFAFGGTVRYGTSIYGGPIYGPWNGWTVVSAHSFRPAVNPHVVVAQNAVTPNSISAAVRTQFAEARRAPAAPAIAVARTQPLHAPTGPRATPRSAPSQGLPAVSSGSAGRNAAPRDAATSRTRPPAAIPAPEVSGDSRPRISPDVTGATETRDSDDSRSRAVSRTETTTSSPSRPRLSIPDSSAPATSRAVPDASQASPSRSRVSTDRMPATSRSGMGDPAEASEPAESRARTYGTPSAPRSEPIMAPSRSFGAPRGRVESAGSSSPSASPSSPAQSGSAPASAPSRSGTAVGRPSGSSAPASPPPAPAAAPSRSGGGDGGTAAAAAPRRGRGGL